VIPPRFGAPSLIGLLVVLPIVVVGGILIAELGGLLFAFPVMPSVTAIPVAVIVTEREAAAGGDRNRYVVGGHSGVACNSQRSAGQGKGDKGYLYRRSHALSLLRGTKRDGRDERSGLAAIVKRETRDAGFVEKDGHFYPFASIERQRALRRALEILLASPTRLERVTYGLGNRCSIRLSYGDA
jgi:hypothetical protein